MRYFLTFTKYRGVPVFRIMIDTGFLTSCIMHLQCRPVANDIFPHISGTTPCPPV